MGYEMGGHRPSIHGILSGYKRHGDGRRNAAGTDPHLSLYGATLEHLAPDRRNKVSTCQKR